MNNGRPNQGNPGMWGQQMGPGSQQAPYQQPGMQTGYQQPYQPAPQQMGQQGFPPRQNMPQGNQQTMYQRPGYQQAPYQGAPQQQPYQQGFQQPNYSQVNQAPYQQGYRPQPQRQQRPVQPQQFQQPQNPYHGQQPYPGQPYPGYQQQYQGGYQQNGYQQPQKKPFDPALILWVMLCGVLPVLFVLGLVLGGAAAIKWAFVVLAVMTVACLWVKPVMASNLRLTFSGVYGALAVVALVGALTAAAPADSNANQPGNSAGSGAQMGSQVQQQAPAATDGASLGDWATEMPVITVTPQPDGLQSAAVEQMKSFFYFWSVNNQDNMVSLCAPSWRKSVEEPKVKLFSILANRTPVEYTAEKISGTENDTARTVTVTALINKNNGKNPEKYRFQVIMVKEDGQWYVDPASLESHETVATTPPTANETATPTAEFIASANTVLYYNANGGERYHLDAYCKSANEKYLPFKGQFYYSQLNEDAFKELVACNVCGAPLRGQ